MQQRLTPTPAPASAVPVVQRASPALTGVDAAGAPVPSQHHDSLVAAGRRWALHILEGPWAWALAAAYIAGTVISGYPVGGRAWQLLGSCRNSCHAQQSCASADARCRGAGLWRWGGCCASAPPLPHAGGTRNKRVAPPLPVQVVHAVTDAITAAAGASTSLVDALGRVALVFDSM